MAEKEQENVSNSAKDSVSSCETCVGLHEQDKQSETLRCCRCDRNEREWSEAIYDCTGEKNVNQYKKNRPFGRFFFCIILAYLKN